MDDLKTAVYRKQHSGIVENAQNIQDLLDPDLLKNNSHGIRKLITKLSNSLKIHLILEDRALYPILINSSDGKIRDMSRKYIDEMGTISDLYISFSQKWKTGSSIKNHAAVFIDETKNILKALLDRIERENTELYQIIDKM